MVSIKEIRIPDIGGASDVTIIEVMVKPGDVIAKEASLITLESDKASMEIPSPYAGTIKTVVVKVGDKVSEDDVIMTIEASEEISTSVTDKKQTSDVSTPASTAKKETPRPVSSAPSLSDLPLPTGEVHAGPSVRRIAREFGVDLRRVGGSGAKGRIVKEDVQNYVKAQLARAESGGGFTLAPAQKIDFSKFGEITVQPLSKIKKLTGANVHRSWVTIPHVTQFAEADITDLEKYRQAQKSVAEEKGVKLTPLVFIMKAVVASLQAFPSFNSSLDATSENIVLKHYYHIGIAVDTPTGLVVPVIRDVDKKSIFDLAKELSVISQKARDVGLTPAEMSGSTFTISSLGGIGGTAFTPIIKAPDVGILGVSRAAMKPVYEGTEFIARLMLPLSLSYDHRVIDGAEGARFIVDLTQRLEKISTIL